MLGDGGDEHELAQAAADDDVHADAEAEAPPAVSRMPLSAVTATLIGTGARPV
jgi:hypothetical protein